MTALKKYQRLESPGLWRDTPEAQRREVVVAFRDATLVLSDPRTGKPLTHWSLPALVRVNPGASPALFAPAPDDAETLEIDDADMIAALETVLGAVRRGAPHPGRLRGRLVAGLLLALLGAGVVMLPPALLTRSAGLLPVATRAAIGEAALSDILRLTGRPCSTPLGDRALALLSDRLFGAGGPRLHVLKDGLSATAHLPGNILLLADDLLAKDDPAIPAGYLLAEGLRAAAGDPVLPVLAHAGLTGTLRLLATGSLPAESLRGYAETLLTAPPAPVRDEALLAAFAKAGVASSPYAWALDPSGESTLPLIEADPFRTTPPAPPLSPADWDSLRTICQ